MNELEWLSSNDVGSMLEFLCRRREAASEGVRKDLTRSLHRFFLASCRTIWPLLPHEGSRRGVELAERLLDGEVTAEQVKEYNWHTEGAAFFFDYARADDPDDMNEMARYIGEVETLPAKELQHMLHAPMAPHEIEPRELLKRAAYFADYSMIYPNLRGFKTPPARYRPFLSADILRQHVEYPRSDVA